MHILFLREQDDWASDLTSSKVGRVLVFAGTAHKNDYNIVRNRQLRCDAPKSTGLIHETLLKKSIVM